MSSILTLLLVLGTLSVLEPDGSVKFYTVFPIGRNQVNVIDLDRGNIWSIQKWDERGNVGNIVDYEKGEIYHWNYIDGPSRHQHFVPEEE